MGSDIVEFVAAVVPATAGGSSVMGDMGSPPTATGDEREESGDEVEWFAATAAIGDNIAPTALRRVEPAGGALGDDPGDRAEVRGDAEWSDGEFTADADGEEVTLEEGEDGEEDKREEEEEEEEGEEYASSSSSSS